MAHENYDSEWLAAAHATGFVPFEVAEPLPTTSWVCGFGRSGGGLSLEVAHNIDGEEIVVETAVGDVPSPDDSEIRDAVLRSVESVLENGVTLPFTLHLTFEHREVDIMVDGAPVTFRGVTGTGHEEWQLRADVGDGVTVKIQGRTGCDPPTKLRRRSDLEIAGLITSE